MITCRWKWEFPHWSNNMRRNKILLTIYLKKVYSGLRRRLQKRVQNYSTDNIQLRKQLKVARIESDSRKHMSLSAVSSLIRAFPSLSCSLWNAESLKSLRFLKHLPRLVSTLFILENELLRNLWYHIIWYQRFGKSSLQLELGNYAAYLRNLSILPITTPDILK